MRFPIFIALVLLAATATAQNLSVFNLDATNFPTLKAQFYAFDANGQQQSPSASEITVTEDGIPRTVTSITCPPKKDPSAITLGIMVDTYSGIDLAKYGAQKLINLLSIPPSEAGITMMDHGAFIVQDLTQKTGKLTTAIAKLQPAPGVDLETMFYAPNAGGVPFVSGGPNKKVLVLLSDLHCPQYNLNKAQLFADCAAQNISVYVVLLNTNDYNGYFKDITANTGGALFQEIKTSADLDKVILQISASITNNQPCVITWQSDVSCTSDNRTVSFSWSGQTANASYALAASAIAGLQFSPTSLYIRSKLIGVQFDTTVIITAVNSAFSVTNITSTNPSYDINPKTFSLAKGETKTLTVSYTPPDSSYTWTRFDIANDRCAQTYYASASYPGRKPTLSTLKLTQPNGGEIYLIGSDTLITWKGIPLTDTVKLEYSLDAGNSWNFITDNATGGKYNWHVPETVSDRCLVRVEQLTSNTKGWAAMADGVTYMDVAQCNSIAIDADGNTYVTGSFQGNVDFGGITLHGQQEQDIFIARYSPEGKIVWAKRAGGGGHQNNSGSGRDAGNGITTDKFGNIYVTGVFAFDTLDFDGNKLTDGDGSRNLFLVKFNADGKVLWAKNSHGTSTEGIGISADQLGNIFITGIFYRTTFFDSAWSISITANDGPEHRSEIFVVKFHSDGSVEWAKRAGGIEDDGGTAITTDTFGNCYLTGYFSYDGADFDGILLNGGYESIFAAKYSSDGNIIWAKTIDSTDYSYGNNVGLCIAVDSSQNVYVGGSFGDTAYFDSLLIQKGGGFITKYTSNANLVWLQKTGDGCSSLTIDDFGNILSTGQFHGNFDFNGVSLTAPYGNTFYAKYRPDGSIISATCPNVKYPSEGKSIISDQLGNVFIAGRFRDTAKFGETILKPIGPYDNDNAFVWKIGGTPLQSDTSDAVFSIIAPVFSFSSSSIDLGQVETGTEKDSVVKATICNSGNMPLHVLGMDVTGGDKAEFMIMSGAGDFTLQPGECRDVMFSYLPMLSGKVSATVTLRTANGNYPDTIKILGEGIAPLLAVMGNTIDFGQVKIGTYKDTTIVIAIENIGKTTVNFSPATQLGPDVKQFSLQSGAAGFTLSAGATQSISLRFTPRYIGRTSGRIGFGYSGPSTPAIMNVYGQGLGGLVSIADYSGYPGEHKYIPMILEKVPVSSVQSLATNFSARIAYDNSVLSPDTGVVQKGNNFDTVNVAGALKTSDTLIYIPFTALLGERTFTPLNIVDFNWLDGAGNPVDYDVDTKSGTFTVSNACGDSLLRNFMLTGKMAAITSISPNPSKSITHIEIQTTEKGRTQLAVMNLLGLKVATIWDSELQTGSHSFDLKTSDLPSGSYFLVMTTPTVRRMERIDVAK